MKNKKNKKIKILRILSRLNVGGPSIHTILLTAGLDKSKYETILVVGQENPSEGNMFNLANEKNVIPVIIPEMGREISLRKDLIAVKKIMDLIIKEKPDIIHTHTSKAGFLGRVSLIMYNFMNFASMNTFKSNIKVFHTFHGNILKSYFGKIKTLLFLYIEILLARFTTKIICITDLQKNELLDYGIAQNRKLVTIPIGLELNRFLSNNNYSGQLRTELGIDRETILFGIVARLVPVKNHMLFLNGMLNLIKSNFGEEVKAIIVGDGECRNDLEKFVKRNNLKDHIYFLGFRNDLENIYSDLDIMVLTSNNEGSPVALIEAMTSNLPIITTNVGGIGDVLGVGKIEINLNEFVALNSGIIFNSKDLVGFTKALKFMFNDTVKKTKFGMNSNKLVYPKYDISMLCNNIDSLYINHLNTTV